jgi:putative FmdB family regulatory protein
VIKIPIFEYRCTVCNNVDEKLEFGNEMDQDHICSKCNKPSEKIVSTSRFELKYNNKTDMCDWQGNTSMYWNDVKKQQAAGMDVK